MRNLDNDFMIDRAAQKSSKSWTGMKGFCIQDCGIQESMGPISDRMPEASVSLLANRISAALAQSAVRDPLIKAGLQPCQGGQAEFSARIRASEQLWVPLLRQLNLQLD